MVNKGQTITFLKTVSNKIKKGTKWVVIMEAGEPKGHQAANAVIQKLGKKGQPLDIWNNPNNQAGVSKKDLETLIAAELITIEG